MQEPLAAALVRRFYAEVWNRRSAEVAREILAPDFAFRGSLDAVRTSAEGFIDYMHKVHDALGGYTCTIVDLVASGDRAVACLDFHGVHRSACPPRGGRYAGPARPSSERTGAGSSNCGSSATSTR
jgi:predicted ester cyclase